MARRRARALPRLVAHMTVSILSRALVSAALSSLTTVAVASALSRLSGRSAAEPMNAVGSHMAGRHASRRAGFALQSTLPGVLINLGGCLFWAGVMERWIGEHPLAGARDALGRGAIAASLAYLVDYHGIPRRLRPGYERKLSTAQLLLVYSSLAFSLPLRAWVASEPLRASPHRQETSCMVLPPALVAGITIG
jgi:hypothetical protein